MKLALVVPGGLLCSSFCFGQVAGGAVYNQGPGNGQGGAEANERAKRVISKDDMPPTPDSMFVDANVMLNVKADDYIAWFGVSEDGASLDECRQKVEAKIHQLVEALHHLASPPGDIATDFVAQNRVYGFDITGEIAKEKLTGYELKKNVSVHYMNPSQLDQFVAAAAKVQVFDLIKVDYTVKDIDSIRSRLLEEAAKVVKDKIAGYDRLLGVKLSQPQIYADRMRAYYPSGMYDSYTAEESQDLSVGYTRTGRYVVLGANKMRTFYYNALAAKEFDHVVNPVVSEPVVQFTLYLKVKYRTDVK